eukprot:scaffold37586_cov298-Amphora_coffeaeformis.AAC.1
MGWPQFGRDKDFLPGNAPLDGISNGLTNGGMIEVQVCPVDVSSTQQQVPQDGSSDEDVVVCRGSTTHAQTDGRHATVRTTRQGQEHLVNGPRLGRGIIRHDRCPDHVSVSDNFGWHDPFGQGYHDGKQASNG